MGKRRRRLTAACLLLSSLPGCFTAALWRERHLEGEETRTTTPHARATDARLLRAPDGDTLHVWLDVDGQPLRVFALQPHAEFVAAFADAMANDEAPRLVLRVRHHGWPNGRNEWQAQLDATPAMDPRATHVPLRVFPLGSDAPATTGTVLTIHAVEWTEVHTTVTIDALNIAWRVAATPFAIVADVVVVIPMAVIGAVVWLTDPGLLTG